MTRPIKYKTADDLLDNCHVINDCYIWPECSNPIPVLGPKTKIAERFGTTSIVRILFVLCRYIPLGKRLVRKCKHDFCVNPFHYTESSRIMEKRSKLPNPNGLFPQQEDVRELIAPSDAEIEEMRPHKYVHIKRLMDSAVIAGYDGEGLGEDQRYVPPRKRLPNFAPDDQPVLIIKSFEPPRDDTPAVPMTDEEWEEIENSFRKKAPLPEVRDEIDHEVEHDNTTPALDIFEAIRRRKEWEDKK